MKYDRFQLLVEVHPVPFNRVVLCSIDPFIFHFHFTVPVQIVWRTAAKMER